MDKQAKGREAGIRNPCLLLKEFHSKVRYCEN